VQPDRDLMADQAGRNRVDDLAHLDGAGAAHPHHEQFVVGKAKRRQGAQLLQLLLVEPLPGGVEGCEHLSQQLAVFGNFLKITAATQDQLLLQPPFEIAMGPLDDAVFVGDAAVVAAFGQPVVVAESLVPGCDVDAITVTSKLTAPALQRRKPHAEQQGQLTGSATIGHALIEDLQGLPAVVRRRQSSPSSPQKA
jgi:hypothetical protein